MSIYTSVLSGLAELEPLDARDEACAELALAYARALEDGQADDGGLRELGPKLLSCLVQLQMTPGARAAIAKDTGGPQVSPVDEIRQKREERGA